MRVTDLIKAALAVLVLSLSLATPVAAGPLEDALAAYNRGDYAMTLRLVSPLAEQGNPAAQYNLGVMYDNGRGVPQDFAEAAKWYRKAADQGLAIAQINLGLLYELGQGVPQDYVQAHLWCNLAAAHFPASERVSRDDAIFCRDFVAAKMTPAQIAEAQRLASEWRPSGP